MIYQSLARIKMVAMDVDGTFTDGILYYDNEGNVLKGFSSHDGMGLELLRRAGIKRGFITGRKDNATTARVTYLGVDFYYSGVGYKFDAVVEAINQFGFDKSECLYIGDDLNDIGGFEAAGVKIAVANAVEEVKEWADYVTKARGGHGAVREVVNMILKAKGLRALDVWMTDRDKSIGAQ